MADTQTAISDRLSEIRNAVEQDPKAVIEFSQELDGLLKFRQLSADFDRPPPSSRLPPILLLIGAFLAASLAFFVPLPSTTIEVEVEAAELSFDIQTRQAIQFAQNVKSFALAGASSIEGLDCIQSNNPFSIVRLDTVNSTGSNSVITLGSLELSPGTVVRALHGGVAFRSQVTVVQPRSTASRKEQAGHLTVNLGGPVSVWSDGDCQYITKSHSMSSISINLDQKETIDIILYPLGLEPRNLTFIPVKNISFTRIDEFRGQSTIVRPLSQILSGSLHFSAIGEEKRSLREGEHLELAETTGAILAFSTKPDRFRVVYSGTVENVFTGAGEGRKSIMPSLFDWLSAKHGLATLWAAGIYIFGTAFAVYRWWKPTK